MVERHEGRLTPADRRLVRELLTYPAEAAFLSTTRLAARTGVHQTTAVRLAKKLGFSGYPALRAQLQAELLRRSTPSDPAERVRRRLSHTPEGAVLETLIDTEVDALRRVRDHVSQAHLDAVARVLIDARRLFLYAHGNATTLVELMDRRLRRSGFDTVDLRAQGRTLAERVLTLGRGDAVVLFAFRAAPPGYVPLVRYAGQVGARTVLVSDLIGTMIRPRPDVALVAPRGGEGEFQTLTVPMLICNALILTIAKLDDGRSMTALDRLGHIAAWFEEGGDGRGRKPAESRLGRRRT